MLQRLLQVRDLIYATSNVTVIAKAKTLPTGEGFDIGTSDITIRQWDQIATNATQVWTEI